MRQSQYAKRFFCEKIPLGNFDAAKTFIVDQFGFDKAFVIILRSKDGHVCYPLFQDKGNNYIVFAVKNNMYECINGELQLISKEG